VTDNRITMPGVGSRPASHATPRRVPFTKGAHEVADGVWAYLQPDGGWGLSNAGLVTGADDTSLLVDTLVDLERTAEMLHALRRATTAAEHISVVVNTHANGDHCYGNALVASADIVASAACADELAQLPASALAALMQSAPDLGSIGELLSEMFGTFRFDDIVAVPPTRRFVGELELRVADRLVRLVEVGPAHTAGDVIVHVPDAGVVFAGDIVFNGGHPIVWTGPVTNWIRACDRVLALDECDTVVPGHGPVAGPQAVTDQKDYFERLTELAHRCFDASMTPLEAARAVDLGPYTGLRNPERLVVNINALYRDFGADVPNDPVSIIALMADFRGSNGGDGG
jgi:glyoxylase-like metal-dependent hydrolase (beta-lactamase superfamily II)